MTAVAIEPISGANLEDIVALLSERNRTLPDYTRWKYGDDGPRGPRGVLARCGGTPIGCFGLIPRRLSLTGLGDSLCGWFADWYVAKNYQGRGIGRRLLQELMRLAPVIIGHPGPAVAANLCKAEGFREVPFHSRRRLILRPWRYEARRTRYFLKACAAVVAGRMKSARTQARAAWPSDAGRAGNPEVHDQPFADAAEHRDWMVRQRVRPGCVRRVGTWESNNLKVGFADDYMPNGVLRRRVMDWSGEGRHDWKAWREFALSAGDDGCEYVENFTTSPGVDRAWARLGALPVAEPAVLAHGLEGECLNLCGWDRENWSFLADESSPGRVPVPAPETTRR